MLAHELTGVVKADNFQVIFGDHAHIGFEQPEEGAVGVGKVIEQFFDRAAAFLRYGLLEDV